MFSIILATLVLGFILQVVRANAADTPHAHSFRRLKNLVEECSFTIGETSFDLCPIVNANEGGWTVEFERRTPPTVTKTSYRIDLKEPLKKEGSLPGHEQCPDGTWICQIISNRRPRHEDEEPRVLQVIPVAGSMNLRNMTKYRPGVNITAQLTPARDDSKSVVLHVRLHGGYYVYGPQKADFQFLCDPTVEEPSTPAYSWMWNGTHTFQWRTKHACGSQRTTKPLPDEGTPPEEDNDSGPPPDEESPSGGNNGQELVDEHPFAGRIARETMILLLSSCTAIVTFAYLVWHPPARVRHYVTKFVRAHPRLWHFRVGERILVRRAYEDMEIDEASGYGGEEDTMVNFAPEEEVGEGIPLKPSPRKGRWTSYGTT